MRAKAACPDCGRLITKRASHCVKCSKRYLDREQRYPHTDPATRFWSKVDKSAGPEGCWTWMGGISPSGYGKFWLDANGIKNIGAHRYSYVLHLGPIPDDLYVCHKCDKRSCVNPTHLFLGTSSDNMQDASIKGRLFTGDQHWTHSHPEWVSHAPKHWNRLAERQGENNPQAKLTAEQVREMRSAFVLGIPAPKLAKKYGICRSTVHRIVKRIAWKHIT